MPVAVAKIRARPSAVALSTIVPWAEFSQELIRRFSVLKLLGSEGEGKALPLHPTSEPVRASPVERIGAVARFARSLRFAHSERRGYRDRSECLCDGADSGAY